MQVTGCGDLSRQQEDLIALTVEVGLVEDPPFLVIAEGGLDACIPDLEEVLKRVGDCLTTEAVDGLHHQHVTRQIVTALDAIHQPLEATSLCARAGYPVRLKGWMLWMCGAPCVEGLLLTLER